MGSGNRTRGTAQGSADPVQVRMSPPHVRAYRAPGWVAGIAAVLDFPPLDRPREVLADGVVGWFVEVLPALVPRQLFLPTATTIFAG